MKIPLEDNFEDIIAKAQRGLKIDDDQLAAVKLTMSRLNISDETLTPRNVLSKISHAKNHGQSSAQIRAEAFSSDGRKTADIFDAYEKLLAQSNALDFDDLLLRSAKLLKDSPNVRERWQQRFNDAAG